MSRNIRDFEEKGASKLAEIFSEAFNDEVSRRMPQLMAEQFIEFSKRPNAKIFVFEDDRSEVIAFLSMFEGHVEYPLLSKLSQ